MGIFPTALIIGAVDRLATATGRPFPANKVRRAITILQIGIMPLFVVAGLVLGVLSVGSAGHFHTPHAVSYYYVR